MPGQEHPLFAEILLKQGLLTEEQVQTVLSKPSQAGRKLGRIIAEAGFASEENVAQALAKHLRISFVDLRSYTPKPDIIHKLPEASARRFRALALALRSDALVVGFADPTDQTAIAEIGRITQQEIAPVAIIETDLLKLIDRFYLSTESDAAANHEEEQNSETQDDSRFDLYISLHTTLDPDVLYKQLQDNIDIDVSKLDRLVHALLDRQTIRVGIDVDRAMTEKTRAAYQRAGVHLEAKESLQLMGMEEKTQIEIIHCPACDMEFPASNGRQCPSCHLVVTAKSAETEAERKRQIEEEELARIQMENEKRKQSNARFSEEEEEHRLREDARNKLQNQKIADLREQQENAARKSANSKKLMVYSGIAATVLALTATAGYLVLQKANSPDLLQQSSASENALTPQDLSKAAVATAAIAQAPAQASEEFHANNLAGKIELMNGIVQILDRNRKPKEVKVGDYIKEGDRIITRENGEIHLKMRDEGFIAVRPDTEMQINSYRAQGDDSDLADLNLQHGSFRAATGWIGKTNPEAYRVQVPNGTINAQSADFEPMVLANDNKAGDPGVYLKTNAGKSQIETAQGRTEVPMGKTAFSPPAGKEGTSAASLLAQQSSAYKTSSSEADLNTRYNTIQKSIDQQRDERRKKVREYCRVE